VIDMRGYKKYVYIGYVRNFFPILQFATALLRCLAVWPRPTALLPEQKGVPTTQGFHSPKFLESSLQRPPANSHPPTPSPNPKHPPNSQSLAPPSLPPMAVPRRWANLDIKLVTEIMNRVPCPIDRARMAAVCQAWLAAVAQAEPSTFQLPSLLLPPADVTGVYCYLSGCREHNMLPLPLPLHGPRYFGSYDGGWFFLACYHSCAHRLLNIRTGDCRALPDVLERHADHKVHSMVILAATLSSPPDHQHWIAAAIVTYQPDLNGPHRRHFAFWRAGDKVALDCDVLPAALVGPGWELEDVACYRDSFHFLTKDGHILVCGGAYDDNGEVIQVALLALTCCQIEAECSDEQFVRARYLVVSRGELLMVVRLAAHRHAPTSSFKVFRMYITEADDKIRGLFGSTTKPPRRTTVLPHQVWRPIRPPRHQTSLRTWIELSALGGRMLFVGRGCSRSYEVREYPGFKEGIFFLDDRSFYDAEMTFGGVNERPRYPCNDIGRWSPPEGPLPSHVELYFPERVPSYNSPPAWLLP
jgi:hypothetical protein